MRKLVVAAIAALFCLSVAAQNNPGKKIVLEELDIRDSSGNVFTADLAKRLIGSGKFGLRVSADMKTAFLYLLSDEAILKRDMNTPKPKESNFFKTGDKIAPFKESDMNGIKYNLKELEGKVVVLNFWFINCPPCRQEIPQLNEMVENYKNNKDVVFIAVALDDKYELKDFLKTSPYKYNIIDKGRYIAEKYGINLYPTHVVLNKEGKVLMHTSGLGMGTVPWIRKSIEAGLNGTELK